MDEGKPHLSVSCSSDVVISWHAPDLGPHVDSSLCKNYTNISGTGSSTADENTEQTSEDRFLHDLERRTAQSVKRVERHDSLLLNFDPLSKISQTPHEQDTPNVRKSLKMDSSEFTTNWSSPFDCVGHLVSPLDDPQLNESNNSVHQSTLATAQNNTSFSPWIHNTVLDLAIGGGNKSPEWSSFITHELPDQTKPIEVDLQDCIPNAEGDSFGVDEHKVSSLSSPLSYVSARTSSLQEVDALIGMMEVVDVNKSVTGPFRHSNSELAINTQSHSVDSVIDNKNNLTASVNDPSPGLIPRTCITPSTYPPSQYNSTLSGLVSRTAKSVYSCLSCSIHDLITWSTESKSNTSKKIGPPDTLHESINGNININDNDSNNKQTVFNKNNIPSSTDAIDFEFDQNCISTPVTNENSLKRTDSFARETELLPCTTKSLNPVDISYSAYPDVVDQSSDDKENINYSQKHIRRNTGIASAIIKHLSTSSDTQCVNETHWNVEDVNSSMDKTRSILGCITPQFDLFSTDVNFGTPNAVPSHAEPETETSNGDFIDVEKELSYLQNELANLYQSFSSINDVMKHYEETLSSAVESQNNHYCGLVEQVIRVADERNAAVMQASRMFAAYDDMLRRVQQTKQLIKSSQLEQDNLKSLCEELSSTLSTSSNELRDLRSTSTERLTSDLSNQAKQQHDHLHQLERLKFKSRQLDVHINSLSQQIKQKDLENVELKNISDQLLRTEVCK